MKIKQVTALFNDRKVLFMKIQALQKNYKTKENSQRL